MTATFLVLIVSILINSNKAIIFFVLNSILSILLIESLNYVSHYGLKRERNKYGRFEKFDNQHAWNSDFILSNIILINLQNHSARHLDWKSPYYKLNKNDKSPKLPYGYITMAWIAFIPPLWKSIMDPLVQRVRRKLPLDLKNERRKKARAEEHEITPISKDDIPKSD